MGEGPHGHVRRKDLGGLLNLGRAPIASYLQSQTASAPKDANYIQMAAYLPKMVWQWLYQYVRYRIGPKRQFLAYAGADNGIYRLAPADGPIRIGLAGDWGTGTDEAALVGEQISAFKPHYTIHLGDIYYVGATPEVEENFLGNPVPGSRFHPCAWPHGSEGTFALNGNHEMLARGVGYFDRVLRDMSPHPASGGQKASYFCLENDHWRIIALDTGYNSVGLPIVEYFSPPDCALRPEIIEWLRTVVRPNDNDPRGIVLLSHHQYFSRYDDCLARPAQQLAEFFRRPVLWFWGHEHRLAIYDQAKMDGGIEAIGRLIGHGGMPVDLHPAKPKHDYAVEFVDDRHYPNQEGLTVGYNGFAKLTLDGNRLGIDYVDLYGGVVFAEAWIVSDGIFERSVAPTAAA